VVSVEMALVAPIFAAIIVGLAEMSRLLDAQTELSAAARLGARLATMDRTDLLAPGQSTNDKITQEVRTYLNASGLPGDAAEVYIVDPVDHSTPFDLDNPANSLDLFELRVELLYSELGPFTGNDWNMTAIVVFRNPRVAVVQ
jgi:hypothetical protein